MDKHKEEKMFAGLESESPEARKLASNEILKSRQEDMQKVAELAEKYLTIEDRKGTAKDIILLLGKLHAVEYVPLLVQNLTFEVFYRETKRPQTIEDLYPSVQALIDIGSPALDPVLERLKHEDGDPLSRTGAAVLRGILGPKWASELLKYEIRTTESSEVKDRLQQVLDYLQELP